MTENNIATALAYYQAMNNKDLAMMGKYLHPNVQFIGAFAELEGKETVLNAVKGILALLNKLTIRAQFESGDQVMLAYDIEYQMPIGHSRTAALLTFQEGLITRYEVFFDARPFAKK